MRRGPGVRKPSPWRSARSLAAGTRALSSPESNGNWRDLRRDVIRQVLFEPFFTTKEIGKGSGLGQRQVLGFAQRSGGGVRIMSTEGNGTTVCIYLPRTHLHSAPKDASEPAPAEDHQASANILLVDDDHGVREVTTELLRDLGYEVLEAGSGGAALDLLQREPRIDLMLIDFAMPGMIGADVARSVHSTKPALPTLFITGYADHRALQGISESQIIGKPVHPDELAHKVRSALTETGAGSTAPGR